MKTSGFISQNDDEIIYDKSRSFTWKNTEFANQINEILADLEKMKQIEVAKKYGKSSAYIHNIAKEARIKKQLEELKYYKKFYKKIKKLSNEEKLKAYGNKMTKEEKEFWASL